MATDRTLIKQADQGRLGSTAITNVTNAVGKLHSYTVQWVKAAQDTNAADNTAEFVFTETVNAGRVVNVYWHNGVNAVANAANNTITLTVGKRLASDPANVINVATGLTTAAGLNGFAAWTRNALTINAANAVTDAGCALTFVVTKQNSGTKLDVGSLVVEVENI